MKWELNIDNVPCALMEELEGQLEKTDVDESLGVLIQSCASGTTEFTVPYDEE